ncbi:hypothetical protein ACM6PT_45315, partial [Klebsiella pneumoniae]
YQPRHANDQSRRSTPALAATRRSRYPGRPGVARLPGVSAAPSLPKHRSETSMASYAELFDIGEDFAAFVGHGLATEQGAV